MLRVFRVMVEFEVLVAAESARDAEMAAEYLGASELRDAFATASEISPVDHLQTAEAAGVPHGDNPDELTVAQILAQQSADA